MTRQTGVNTSISYERVILIGCNIYILQFEAAQHVQFNYKCFINCFIFYFRVSGVVTYTHQTAQYRVNTERLKKWLPSSIEEWKIGIKVG